MSATPASFAGASTSSLRDTSRERTGPAAVQASSPSRTVPVAGNSLPSRTYATTTVGWLVLLGVTLLLEKLFLVHAQAALTPGAVRILSGAPALFLLALFFFGRRVFFRIGIGHQPLSRPAALVHLATLALLFTTHRLLASPSVGPLLLGHRSAVAPLWLTLTLSSNASLVAVLLHVRSWPRITARLGGAWAYALACTAALLLLRPVGEQLWEAPGSGIARLLQNACFTQTRALLHLFYPFVIAVPERHLLGTPRYLVQVSWLCSGVEGLALVTVLLTCWLFFVRHELRLTRTILVLPLALSAAWLFNLLRLALFIAIGDAGHPDIAGNGFHAQAGWISLNLLILGSLLLIGRVRWFQALPPQFGASSLASPGLVTTAHTPKPYLLPIAAIFAASLLTQAASGGSFEALYPLRFAAALLALWFVRKPLRSLDWRFRPSSLLAGLAVALAWLAFEFLLVSHTTPLPADNTAAALAHLAFPERLSWIVIRVLATVTTVPLAEELAFRGFLARRLVRADFAAVRLRDLTPWSIVGSSAAFGLMHGRLWPAGILAGLVFALVARGGNRLGDAVAAHATANLAVAAVALLTGNFNLW